MVGLLDSGEGSAPPLDPSLHCLSPAAPLLSPQWGCGGEADSMLPGARDLVGSGRGGRDVFISRAELLWSWTSSRRQNKFRIASVQCGSTCDGCVCTLGVWWRPVCVPRAVYVDTVVPWQFVIHEVALCWVFWERAHM